ncbi:MAG: CvpA family protein [Planctomycetota bacterium]|jgi:hypothetical protein
MVFWTGALIGVIFAYVATKTGFYEALVMLFNIIISVYLAIYLRPIIVNVPAISDAPCCDALTMFGTAIAAFLVLHGVSYTFLTGQFSIPFPRVFDTLGAACLGFGIGFLIWSFISLVICITPVSQNSIMKGIGFGSRQFEQTNAPYLYWCCDLVNAVVSKQEVEQPTKQAVSELLTRFEGAERAKTRKPAEPAKPTEPAEPAEVKTGDEEQLGPPPEIDFEDI